MTGFDESDGRVWRNDRGAMLAGVCAGLAEDLDLPLPLVRAVALLFIVLPTGLAYLALGLLLRRRPALAASVATRFDAMSRPASYRAGAYPSAASVPPSGRSDRTAAAPPAHQDWALLKHRFATIEKKIGQLEGVVTADDFELQRDFRRMEP